MKAKNLLAVAALCLFSGNAAAQETNYSSVYFQYNPSWLSYNVSGAKSDYLNGFTLGYTKSFGIAGDNSPLFLEVGANLQYAFKSKSESESRIIEGTKVSVDVTDRLNMLSLNVPVNFGYSIRLGDGLALNPYVGVRLRLNLLATETEKATVKVGNSSDTEKETLNLFSKDDMGGSDNTWSRFQIAWRAGAKMVISEAFYVEAGYEMDFNRIAERTRFSSVNLGIGYVF
ncbi:MAG: outer membrane beta-barrel protein [Bacteroidaceae bacterium]|nr:outer membrane beta-barrel protein [Bacteroidaceae bacterium]